MAPVASFMGGGSMIRKVTKERTTWADPPARFEAGTPAISQAIGMAAAIRWLDGLGMEAATAHEREMAAYALERLAEVPGLTIFGPPASPDRLGPVSFELDGVHGHDVAEILDRHGVAVRAGHHCAQPLMDRLGVAATARASVATGRPCLIAGSKSHSRTQSRAARSSIGIDCTTRARTTWPVESITISTMTVPSTFFTNASCG